VRRDIAQKTSAPSFRRDSSNVFVVVVIIITYVVVVITSRLVAQRGDVSVGVVTAFRVV
jgi:t-SNARE complex subunit (syntaxin)